MNFLIGGVEVSISFEDGLSIEWDDGYLEIPAPFILIIISIVFMIIVWLRTGK